MAKTLIVDKNFTLYHVATGDEIYPNGIFEFNITKMLEYIKKELDSITLEEVAVKRFLQGFFIYQ